MHVLRILGRIVLLISVMTFLAVTAFVLCNWEVSLAKYGFASYPPFEEKVEIYLPQKYTLANKSADGSYITIESLTVTNAFVPLEAYKLFAETGENTVVVLGSGEVHYLVKVRGTIFHSTLKHELVSKLKGAKLDSTELRGDNHLILHGSKDDALTFLLFILGSIGCLFLSSIVWIFAKPVLSSLLFSEKSWFSPKAAETRET